MLREIITRKLPSRCILIQDSVKQSGHMLWEAFIQHAVDEGRDVHIYSFETPVAEVQRNIKESDHKKIHYYDVFYDHQNWLQSCGKCSGCAERLVVGPKCLQCADDTKIPEGDRVVFVDSLSLLIFSTGLCDTYAQLHALCNTGQVVCVVHEDVLPTGQGTLDALNHLATTYLCIRPPNDASEGNPFVEIRHMKPGGGILRQTEIFRIGADKEVISEMMSGSGRGCGTNNRFSNSSQLPQDLTTFKLDLEQNEKQARSKLVLPYIRPSMDSAAQSGESKVFYQPDAADDWDEEDPDDDLDV